MPEITFILEPDAGVLTVESSSATAAESNDLRGLLGQGSALNCARPRLQNQTSFCSVESDVMVAGEQTIRLFRLYHRSTVDGPGRRSVVQVAGCSRGCLGCYVPETHDPAGGVSVSIDWLVEQIVERRREHDGVTVLGGEPFEQLKSLNALAARLKTDHFHLTIYTGFTLENLRARNDSRINQILANTDLLIDGAFDRNLTKNAGEYRGSSNQRLIPHPLAK